MSSDEYDLWVISFFRHWSIGYVRLSRIYRGLGQIPAAIEYLSRGRAIAPDSVDIQVSLGDAYSSLGQLEEAKKLYEGVSRQVSRMIPSVPS